MNRKQRRPLARISGLSIHVPLSARRLALPAVFPWPRSTSKRDGFNAIGGQPRRELWPERWVLSGLGGDECRVYPSFAACPAPGPGNRPPTILFSRGCFVPWLEFVMPLLCCCQVASALCSARPADYTLCVAKGLFAPAEVEPATGHLSLASAPEHGRSAEPIIDFRGTSTLPDTVRWVAWGDSLLIGQPTVARWEKLLSVNGLRLVLIGRWWIRTFSRNKNHKKTQNKKNLAHQPNTTAPAKLGKRLLRGMPYQELKECMPNRTEQSRIPCIHFPHAKNWFEIKHARYNPPRNRCERSGKRRAITVPTHTAGERLDRDK